MFSEFNSESGPWSGHRIYKDIGNHWYNFWYEIHSLACIWWSLRHHGPSKSSRCPVSSCSFCGPPGSAMFFWSFWSSRGSLLHHLMVCAQSEGMQKLSSILSSALFLMISFFGHLLLVDRIISSHVFFVESS